MTEQEWLVSADPENMLRFLIPLTPRRGRLFSCACCRSMWHLLSDMGKTALKIAEQYADGQATLKDLLAFTLRGPRQYSQPTLDDVMTVNLHYYVAYNIDLNAVMGTVDAPYYNVDTSVFFVGTPSENVSEGPVSRPDWACANAIRETLFPQQDFAVYEFVGRAVLRACGDVPAMLRTQCGILRDIFGNPFRRVTFDPQWLTFTVLALAQTMYDSRDFSAMPILADALQDAGCDSDDVLAHCRSAGPHVRGCWVIDLLLGLK